MGTGQLINLDDGGTGVDPAVIKAAWKKRLSDPEELKRVQKVFSARLTPEVRRKAIQNRQQNVEYVAKSSERMRSYAADPSKQKKAMETRAKNPNWLNNIKKASKERFEDSQNLEAHRQMMQTSEYIEAHAKGMKKHEKGLRMYFPPSWGAPDGYFVECESQTKMCLAMNFNGSSVSMVISGKRHHHQGFIFRRAPAQGEPEPVVNFHVTKRKPSDKTLKYFELINSGMERRLAAATAGLHFSNALRLEKNWPELKD